MVQSRQALRRSAASRKRTLSPAQTLHDRSSLARSLRPSTGQFEMAGRIRQPSYDSIHRLFNNISRSINAIPPSVSPTIAHASPVVSVPAPVPVPVANNTIRARARPVLRPWLNDGVLLNSYSNSRLVPLLALHQRRALSSSITPAPPKCSNPDCPHDPLASPPSTTSTTAILSSSTSLTKQDQPPVTAISKPHPSYLASLPPSLRKLAANLPSSPGRPPSRDQLLALTSSFFERLRIRFKYMTIRSYRHFRADDWGAFFSFGLVGTLGWLLIGTSSFVAFVFLIINSLQLQKWVAGKLGDYLTQSTGMTVVFESAIIPKWGFAGGGSKISFKNVYISRGPTKAKLGVLPPLSADDERELTEEELARKEQMAKWTHFHMSIDTVDVSLSLARWLDGNGLVKDVTVKGVRGVVDRSHIEYDPDAPRDRFAYRHHSAPGDFFLENLQIEDFLVTVYQPEHFRPYTFSIFNADIRRLRKQWLFYDLLSADAITGQVDNCLFSLHKPQSIGRTSEEDLKDVQWARMSRFRIDGVPIDHMQTQHDTGVMSWVTSGRCDLVADIRFPRDEADLDLSSLIGDIVEKFDKEIGAHLHPKDDRGKRIPGRGNLSKNALEVPKGWSEEEARRRKTTIASASVPDESIEEEERKRQTESDDKTVSIEMDIRFKDLKASVPYFTSRLSYVNNALIRPIVAFINSNKTLIPIRFTIDLPLSEFDGSWTTYDVGLLDRLSEQTYLALAWHVQSSSANQQRLATVSLWTAQRTAKALVDAFRYQLAPY
ncbi:hypothetical protein T439DRAFT_322546 [Meredithblackwellia eburnea MCA 4105]